MAEKITIFYKPACMTCEGAIRKLKDIGFSLELHDFFQNKLTDSDLKRFLRMTGLSARDLLRKKDKMYKELKLAQKEYSENQLIQLILKHPGLLARPIIIRRTKAIVGNTPERLEEFCRS